MAAAGPAGPRGAVPPLLTVPATQGDRQRPSTPTPDEPAVEAVAIEVRHLLPSGCVVVNKSTVLVGTAWIGPGRS